MMSTKNLAIVCLTVIVIACVFQGVNHVLIATVSAIIGGIAGYEFKSWRKAFKHKK